VFHEYQTTERALGNPAVACVEGDVIEFEVPEVLAEAAAKVIRRCIERTNPEAAKRETARQQQQEAQQRQMEAEEKRLKNKFRGGL
jgi:hypothetical protein